jgi:hypothetical protein
MPKRTDLQSILILGSGPIVIGQAAEFDYSDTQAVRALREEGYRVILVNSNPATIMTDPDLADAPASSPSPRRLPPVQPFSSSSFRNLAASRCRRSARISSADAICATLSGEGFRRPEIHDSSVARPSSASLAIRVRGSSLSCRTSATPFRSFSG